MPTYIITHKIDTISILHDSFEFGGFTFSPWSYDSASGTSNGWLAEKSYDARNIHDAGEEFAKEFFPIVDRIAFISQCHTSASLQPFLITKADEDRFNCRLAKKRDPVSLSFEEQERASLSALATYDPDGDVFRCLREATNATSFDTRLTMLVAAMEAIAGRTKPNGKREVDKDIIADTILRDKDLFKRLDKYGSGIRNQILHGAVVDMDLHGDTKYNEEVGDKIIAYFNEHLGTAIDTEASGRPRSYVPSFTTTGGWFRWSTKLAKPQLPNLNAIFSGGDYDYLEYCELIEEPADY